MLTQIVNKLKFSKLFYRKNSFSNLYRNYCAVSEPSKKQVVILGIETSCDDTGCGIVNSHGQILGEHKHSQLQFHLRTGGINPNFAQELHRLHIEDVVNKALQEANLSIADVDAIAVTNRPGIDRSLTIGIRYAKHLARTYSKPLIPIHHMEAHALTARLQYNTQLSFPFLCLLASGGHCQLTLVKDVTDFVLIGESLDSAPGSCLDRVARALRLQILPEYRHLSGGKAIEMAAYKSTNSNRYHFSVPLLEYRNCQFSFDGLRGAGIQMIEEIRNRQRIASDEMIPYYEDFCASFLKIITKHLLQRTQRAIQYCDRIGVFGFGNNKLAKSFVFAGGVAANDFIYKAMSQMVTQFGFQTFRCSKKLCADNGVMIAWNGIERWSHDQNIYRQLNIDSVLPDCFARLGIDHSEFVTKKHLKCDFVKVPCMETKQIVSD